MSDILSKNPEKVFQSAEDQAAVFERIQTTDLSVEAVDRVFALLTGE